MLTLVNMILDFAKLEGGPIELSMAEIPVEETLRGAEALVAPQFAKKGVRYNHRKGDPTVSVFADREKVQQILVNLLANAVKFTSAGGAVDLEWRLEENNLLVRVRDTGTGVPDDKIDQIFEPFVQLQGAGIGSQRRYRTWARHQSRSRARHGRRCHGEQHRRSRIGVHTFVADPEARERQAFRRQYRRLAFTVRHHLAPGADIAAVDRRPLRPG